MTGEPLLLAIDQGTTSSRAIIFGKDGCAHATSQQEFTQYFPNDGWVEHDAEEIWESVLNVCRDVLTKVDQHDVVSIGITNQRETTVVWDRRTGAPVYNAIVWQDRRTSAYCADLKGKYAEADVTARTGLLLDPYFSATKLRWILENVEGAREKAQRGDLAFGTVDSFLLWRLTNGRVHATDATNASRTNLYNIHTGKWDDELLKLFDIPASVLPEVKDSSADFGETDPEIFSRPIPIGGIAGDQQAAAFGQCCFKQGMIKSTYGTGCFVLLNTGRQAVASENKLLTTVGYQLNGETTYASEGSIFVAGAAVQWLRDGLGLIESAAETQRLAHETDNNHGVYLVPAFTGLGAPHWDPDARGAIFGLTRDTGPGEFARAALESVCFQTHDLLEAMARDGVHPTHLRVDGGMVANDWLCQFLADIVDIDVERPSVLETTALGAAYLAGLQSGLYQDLEEISEHWNLQAQFHAHMESDVRDHIISGWRKAVSRTLTTA